MAAQHVGSEVGNEARFTVTAARCTLSYKRPDGRCELFDHSSGRLVTSRAKMIDRGAHELGDGFFNIHLISTVAFLFGMSI
jgi:hypothetical protein